MLLDMWLSGLVVEYSTCGGPGPTDGDPARDWDIPGFAEFHRRHAQLRLVSAAENAELAREFKGTGWRTDPYPLSGYQFAA